MVTTPFTIPGIYRQDVFPKSVPVLPTGVPLFLGFTERPLKGKDQNPEYSDSGIYGPYRLTQWPQFAELFSQDNLTQYLAGAVHGFFANGGVLCYVVIIIPTSDQALQHGLEAAEDITDIDLVCAPDLMHSEAVLKDVRRRQQLILEYCDRTNDRFAILDTPRMTASTNIDQIWQDCQNLQGQNGALYGPWILPEQGESWLPPCGHVAGTFARSDGLTGVHRAPANLAIDDALDLSLVLTDTQQQQLNPPDEWAGVNCLRSLTGRGIRIWGVRTLSNDPYSGYVNVRRLLITVGRWVALNLADIAFEPNDLGLWIRVERDITVYLETLARRGALQGRTREEAFFVNCNAETNPPDVRERGQVITEIGLAPTVPSEFIVVRLIHGDTGVTLTSTS